jgi:hypothetical protein
MNGFCCPSSGRIQCRRCIIETGGLNGGTHHANLNDNCCDTGRYRRNRSRQRGSSRSLVRLSSSLLPSSLRLLPLPSPSLLRLSPLLPSSLLPSVLAPRVLGRSFFSSCIAVAASGCRASDKAGVALRLINPTSARVVLLDAGRVDFVIVLGRVGGGGAADQCGNDPGFHVQGS